MRAKILLERLRGRDHSEDLDVDGTIILNECSGNRIR
jgi:hypothetical protein